MRGDNLQISVEVVGARDRTQMWGEIYNRKTADLLAVQAEMARTISEKLRLRLTGRHEQQLAKRSTVNPEAYQLYLIGWFYFRRNTSDYVRKALDYFNQAVAFDPKFALAWTGIANVYRWFGGNSLLDSQEAKSKAMVALSRALELDDSLAEAHRVLAFIKLNDWDWAGAELEYKRTIELDPNPPAAHASYSNYLGVVLGQYAEALVELKRAQELDPMSLSYRAMEGGLLIVERRYDEAIAKLEEVIRLEPDDIGAHTALGYAYAKKGRYAQAIAEYQKAMSLEKGSKSTPCYLGYALAMSGDRAAALVILNKLKTTKEYVSPAELAVLYIGLGDKEGALAELEKAYSA